MMFVVRSAGDAPDIPAVELKASRQTPADVPGGAGKTDYFCIGDAEAIAALRDAGWEVVELRDGWYAGDRGGGVARSGPVLGNPRHAFHRQGRGGLRPSRVRLTMHN